MHTIRIIYDVAFAIMAAYIAWNVYTQYRAEGLKVPPPVGFDRWLATARDSATLLWGKFALFIDGFIANLDNIFTALGMPQVADAINKWIDPKVAAAMIAFFTIMPMIARLRTLSTPGT